MRSPRGAPGLMTAVLALAAVLAGPAFAHPTSSELAAKFARGEYMTAASEAEAAAGADDFAFAARALLAHCMTQTSQPDIAIVERASRDAEAALKLDPTHEEGRLQLAIALSLKSRGMDALAVWTAGYGERGRRLAEDVLRSDPLNFYAHGFLAVWNVEVVRAGGGMGAWMMGASLEAARRHYEAAARMAPDDVGIHWQYARALAALDVEAHGEEAAEALARAGSANAGDHVEQVMQERAARLAAALRVDRAAAQKLARELL